MEPLKLPSRCMGFVGGTRRCWRPMGEIGSNAASSLAVGHFPHGLRTVHLHTSRHAACRVIVDDLCSPYGALFCVGLWYRCCCHKNEVKSRTTISAHVKPNPRLLQAFTESLSFSATPLKLHPCLPLLHQSQTAGMPSDAECSTPASLVAQPKREP